MHYFHAAEDNAHVRRRVLGIIASHLNGMRLDTIVVEKRKTNPPLQREHRFYPEMLGSLISRIMSQAGQQAFSEVIVMTDTIPLKGKRNAIEKAVKERLARVLPAGTTYRIFHHSSMSCVGLQVADYCNWAIFRKWERGDTHSYDIIATGIRTETDIFIRRKKLYY